MQVNPIQQNNINFRAKLISPATIKYKNGIRWNDFNVRFIKFNTHNKADRETIKQVAGIWNNHNMSDTIAEEVDILGNKSEVYAITSQRKNFEKINPTNILSLMTTDKVNQTNSKVHIYRLGSKPEMSYAQNGNFRSIKYFAKSLLQSFVKFIEKNKNIDGIEVYPEPSDIKFLEKMNFKADGTDTFSLNREDYDKLLK